MAATALAARRGAAAPAIPRFFLYGEPPRNVDSHFLHLEDLDDRSRPSGWVIRTHAHANLNHLIYIDRGGGEARFDGESIAFNSPVLLVVPARVVHDFEWVPESSGKVLTIADAYLEELFVRVPSIRPVFAHPNVLPVPARGPEQKLLHAPLSRLSLELAWNAPGHAAAVEANLVTFLVEVLRVARYDAEDVVPGPYAAIVARFRQAIEGGFRRRRPLEVYAAMLGVSLAQLRAACLKTTRKSPIQLLQDRMLVEAKRLLLYSNSSVSEVAYQLGFDDPAYFSRVFQHQAGASPREFRRQQAAPAESARAHRRTAGRGSGGRRRRATRAK